MTVKRMPLVAAFISLVLMGSGCTKVLDNGSGISVAASFYPVAMVAERVGGEFVNVTTLVPSGSEPHDFEPTASEVARVYDSDIFLYNGGGVDAWASKLAPTLESQGVVALGMHSTMASKLPPVELDHEAEDSVEEFDEHFWLDPSLLAVQAEAVRDVLTDIDPEHAAEYKARALAFVAELSGLDKEYREGLASCEKRVAVTSHAAFGYVARAYAFEQLPISGVSPEEEPSAGELADLVEEARQYKVAYVFFETLVNPKLAQTLAEEIGAQTLVFNPIEGLTPEETDRGEDYFSIMRENLANLRTAMICR